MTAHRPRDRSARCIVRDMAWRRVVLITGLVACGASDPAPQNPSSKPWRETPALKADRTIDKWDRTDEDKSIALACQNIVGPDGEFRCPTLAKAGLRAAHCVESFNSMRETLRGDQQVEAFRLLVSGLWLADSCTEVDADFRIAAMLMQHRGQ